MKLTTSAQMKELDRTAIQERNIPSIELMERAAEAVAAAARPVYGGSAVRRGQQRRGRHRCGPVSVLEGRPGPGAAGGRI